MVWTALGNYMRMNVLTSWGKFIFFRASSIKACYTCLKVITIFYYSTFLGPHGNVQVFFSLDLLIISFPTASLGDDQQTADEGQQV